MTSSCPNRLGEIIALARRMILSLMVLCKHPRRIAILYLNSLEHNKKVRYVFLR
jgi:hypothetical protein